MERREAGVNGESLRSPRKGFERATGNAQELGDASIGVGKVGIAAGDALLDRNRAVELARAVVPPRQLMQRLDIGGIDAHGASVVIQSELGTVASRPHRRSQPRLAGQGVERDGPSRRSRRERAEAVVGHARNVPAPIGGDVVRMRQAGISRRETGVQGNGAVVSRYRPRGRRHGPPANRRPPGEVGTVGVTGGRRSGRQPRALGAREAPPDGLGDAHRHRVLHGEHVAQRLIVRLRPRVVARRCLRDLHGDADAVADVSQAPLQHVAHAQVAAHALWVDGPARPESQRRVATGHAQAGHVTQSGDELLGDAFGQGDVGRVTRPGHQVEHGQRWGALDRGRMSGGCRGARAGRRRAVGALGDGRADGRTEGQERQQGERLRPSARVNSRLGPPAEAGTDRPVHGQGRLAA